MEEESGAGERWREKGAKSEKSRKNKSVICFGYLLTKQSIDSSLFQFFFVCLELGFHTGEKGRCLGSKDSSERISS